MRLSVPRLTPSRRSSPLLVRIFLVPDYDTICTVTDKSKFICLDNSEIKGDSAQATLEYDYLVIGTGATNQTFGIKGVEEHACFLKEVWDAQKIRTKVMDCIETAAFPGQAEEEIERLLHMVVVGGGPTGIEYAAELHDFLKEDLASWYPGTYKCELKKNGDI